MQVVDVVPELQNVTLLGSAGDDVYLSFLGQNVTVTIGTDTLADIEAALEALLTVIDTSQLKLGNDAIPNEAWPRFHNSDHPEIFMAPRVSPPLVPSDYLRISSREFCIGLG